MGFAVTGGAVLAIILKELGYQSRCVHLGGHLVSEVFDKNKWKMLDADNNTYFLIDGKIASSDEIAYKSQKCTPVFGKNTMNIFNSLMPQNYISLFTTHDNNVADPWYLENINWGNTHFTLPAHAELELPAYNPCEEKNSPYLFARLKLQRPYKGFLDIPFVIHSVKGNGHIFNLHAADEKKKHENFLSPGNYLVLSDSIDIYLYVNPFLFDNITGTAKVELVSNKENSLRLESRPYNFDYTPNLGLRKFENILEKKIELYKQAFATSPEYYYDTINLTSVEQLNDLTHNFYLKTRNIEKMPDSVVKKINTALEILKQQNHEGTKVFIKMRYPFHRNIIMMMMIELPVEEIQNTFDFYFNNSPKK